ncbi:pumilio 18-like [Salvia divinorum]|uniref:Pumilio 18-like n=1 Tax=Salvia divinorum TaxID=28513 RepID=A0ABD1G257_SALDI
MDNPTPNHGENHRRKVVLRFGNFKMWSDGDLELGAAADNESCLPERRQEFDYKAGVLPPSPAKNGQLFVQKSSFSPEHGFSLITSNVVYTGFDVGSTSDVESRPRFDLSWLLELLKGGDGMDISMLLLIMQGSYLHLMMDITLSAVFKKLVGSCRGNQLDLIVEDVLFSRQSFISAAFCKQGASSICKLIKRVKKPSHALAITQIFSTRFWAIMTHETARSVMQACFDCFLQPNKVLYEQSILYCQELAKDKVGCLSLNELIKKISGEERSRLLNTLAACSAELSFHEYGNYVVQFLLSLRDELKLSSLVVVSLRGRIVELALQKRGSHVVEKCIMASNLGLMYVVKEIVITPKASLQLAQDLYGNYVIQKAFKEAKERGLERLCEFLKKSLEPYRGELNQTMGGKIVLGFLNDEGATKGPTTACKKNTRTWVWRRL